MVGHPFDTLKTKMQAQKGFESGGMIQTFSKTIKTQGVIGLYRQAIFVLLRSETKLFFVVSILEDACLLLWDLAFIDRYSLQFSKQRTLNTMIVIIYYLCMLSKF